MKKQYELSSAFDGNGSILRLTICNKYTKKSTWIKFTDIELRRFIAELKERAWSEK